MAQNQGKKSVSWTGIFLIIIGGLLLLETLDIIDIGMYLRDWWPAVIILLGILKLQEQNKAGAFFFIIAGVVLLSLTLDVLSWASVRSFWPLVLILIGVYILWNRGSTNRHGLEADSNDRIQIRAIFGGVDRRINSSNFNGGYVEAFFGGVEIDLRDSVLSPEGARLDISAVFGGVEITVPRDWRVRTTGTPILGGIESSAQSPAGTENGKILHCQCTAIFGGVEIKQ